MKKIKRPIFPKAKIVLDIFGENIKLARLRRKFSTKQVSERAGIGESTLLKIEKGDESVAMGSYFRVLFVLGLYEDFLLVAKDDELGRKLQDIGMVTKKRAPKRMPKDK
ncbi:MAG: helix-turn-helix transcriptional regulator [Bacteriovoracaceae bacterium]|nr:helix-turn-helix transcriptional regulator [Bacteriovoracaceae bacterium]